MNLGDQRCRVIEKRVQEIIIKPGAAQNQDRIRQNGFPPVMMDREQIKLQRLLNLGTKVKTGVGMLIEIVDILSHTQEFILISFYPVDVIGIFRRLRFSEDIGSGVEIVTDIPMGDIRFTNWLHVNRTDLIPVDLRQDLPVGNAEGFPLGLSTFRAIAKPLGGCGTAVVHGHEEPIGGVGRAGGIRTGMEGLIERESSVFPDEGVSRESLK